MRQCRHALEDGCKRCIAGYHCREICAADRQERKRRRAIRYHARRKQARRHPERGSDG